MMSLDVRLCLHQRPALGQNLLHLSLQSSNPCHRGHRRWWLSVCLDGDIPFSLLLVLVSGGCGGGCWVDKDRASRDRDDLTGHHWIMLWRGAGTRETGREENKQNQSEAKNKEFWLTLVFCLLNWITEQLHYD